MDKFPNTCDRFIAYFDIMGFRDLSYRNSHEEIAKIMNFVSENIQAIKVTEEYLLKNDEEPDGPFEKAIIMPIVFSDTIILISGSNTFYDARKAIYAASFLLSKMLKMRVPVKGALSYGLITANLNKSIYFGRPLIDAYLLCDETFFYGATLHHSMEKYLSENDLTFPNAPLKHGQVPMKTGQVTHYYIDLGKKYTDYENNKTIVDEFYLSVSGGVRRYVDNSLSVYAP